MLKVSADEFEEALRKALGPFRLDHVELREGFDHDGEAAVFVTAVLKPNAPPMPGEFSTSANVAVAQLLERAGDERLSYLYLKRPDDLRDPEEAATESPPKH
ncbi:MAG: hypothetical protein ACRECV_11520 [Xanthobacteraceae bacterium]